MNTIHDVARFRLLVDAFTQHLFDSKIQMMKVVEGGSLVEVHPVELQIIKQNFHTKVIDAIVKLRDPSNKSL